MSVKHKGFSGFGGFAAELAEHGRRRPWIWALPAAGLAARRLIGGILENGAERGAGSALLGLLITLAVTAAFAEFWIAEKGRPDAGRWSKALLLFLLPYPALLVVGWLSAQSLQFWVERGGSGLDAVVAADLALSKVASLLITILSAFAFARWKRGRGSLEALASGRRVLWKNAVFVVALGAATWIAQELVSVVFSFWHDAAAGASPETFDLARVAQDYLVVAAALIGCVAAPISASASGRLVEP